MILLSILWFILIGLGVLLIALIFAPYHYDVCGDSAADLQIKGSVSWLFGGIKIIFSKYARQNKELTLKILGKSIKLNSSTKETKGKNKDTKSKKDAKKSKQNKLSNVGAFLKRDVIEKIFSTLGKILKHCGPKYLTIDARIGFNDPMYTGLMSAFTNQFYSLLSRYDITIEPVFDEEVFEGRYSIGGKIWLPYLIQVIIGLLITKPIRNILFTKNKKKK